MPHRPTKIISGGQTGVDQGSLRAAKKAGLAVGGWCPPGRVCEAAAGDLRGRIPPEFSLIETPADRSPQAPDVPRSLRTEWNVRDSDATLILRYLGDDGAATLDPGTAWTAVCAVRHGRPLLICDPRDAGRNAQVGAWLAALSIRTLNVAGPSEKTAPGIGELVETFLSAIFQPRGNRAGE